MEVQARYLAQLKERAGGLPILFSGDLFDRWNAPAELIHFALKHLPDGMICVAGQHDLPHHRMDLMHRSAYGVLKAVGKIIDISEGEIHKTPNFVVRGFGWNIEILPLEKRAGDIPHIALIHKYTYLRREHSYPGASQDFSFKSSERVLRTYDSVVIGDNHIPWMI